MYRGMDDVVEAVRDAKGRKKSCALLLGAGGAPWRWYPLASGFVEIIQERWPSAYEGRKQKAPAG